MSIVKKDSNNYEIVVESRIPKNVAEIQVRLEANLRETQAIMFELKEAKTAGCDLPKTVTTYTTLNSAINSFLT